MICNCKQVKEIISPKINAVYNFITPTIPKRNEWSCVSCANTFDDFTKCYWTWIVRSTEFSSKCMYLENFEALGWQGGGLDMKLSGGCQGAAAWADWFSAVITWWRVHILPNSQSFLHGGSRGGRCYLAQSTCTLTIRNIKVGVVDLVHTGRV